jgi:hypothetical protein
MYGEGFYNGISGVPRLSDISDTASDNDIGEACEGLNIDVGSTLLVEGQHRSYNKYHEGHNKLILTVLRGI